MSLRGIHCARKDERIAHKPGRETAERSALLLAQAITNDVPFDNRNNKRLFGEKKCVHWIAGSHKT